MLIVTMLYLLLNSHFVVVDSLYTDTHGHFVVAVVSLYIDAYSHFVVAVLILY